MFSDKTKSYFRNNWSSAHLRTLVSMWIFMHAISLFDTQFQTASPCTTKDKHAEEDVQDAMYLVSFLPWMTLRLQRFEAEEKLRQIPILTWGQELSINPIVCLTALYLFYHEVQLMVGYTHEHLLQCKYMCCIRY